MDGEGGCEVVNPEDVRVGLAMVGNMITGVADTIAGVFVAAKVCGGSGRGAPPQMSQDERIRDAIMKIGDLLFMF